MEPTQSDANPGENAEKNSLLEAFEQREKTIGSKTYARTMRAVLDHFEDEMGVYYLEDITTDDCRGYAAELHALTKKDDVDMQASTARKYFNTLRAFLNWAVEDRRMETNPAKPLRASKPLPDETSDPDRQVWSIEDREAFLSFVDHRNMKAQDGEIDVDPYVAQRDQTMIYLLALTGARGAEVFRVSNDRKRRGLRWKDVGDEAYKVFGKSRDEERIGYTGPESDRLDRWRRRLKPPSEDWPVFPTLYPGTLHRADHGVGDELEAAGYERSSDVHPIDACREHGITPPAITVQKARDAVRALSKEVGLPSDEEDGHLKLHGARRGLGWQLYDEDPVEAQRTLRHNSIETTFEAYSEKEAAKSGRRRAEILDLDGE